MGRERVRGRDVERGRDVVVVVGSLRRDSWNRRVMEHARSVAPPDLHLDVVGLDEVPPFDEDLDADPPPGVAALKARIAAADGVILAVPEYNLGLSGVAKNAIDWISRPEFAGPLVGKPVAIMSVSTSRAEPERAAAQARLSAQACGAVVMDGRDLTIRSIRRRVEDAHGQLPESVTGPLHDHLVRFAAFLDQMQEA